MKLRMINILGNYSEVKVLTSPKKLLPGTRKCIQNHTVGMHQKDSLGVQSTVPVWNLNSKLKEIC